MADVNEPKLDAMQDIQYQLDDLQSQLKTTVLKNKAIPPVELYQGPGSGLDSDKVDGINANYKPMPSCLVPLGPTGQFPSSVISSNGNNGFAFGNVTPTDKNILIADGVDWESVAVSGDISITADTGSTTVVAINNTSLGTTTATSGNLLVGSGTQWVTKAISGDATLSSLGVITLANSGVTAGSYGDSTHFTTFTVDAKGRLTTASSISVPSTSPGGNNGDVQFNNSNSFGGSDNLFWNNTTQRLGINTNAPTRTLHLFGHNGGDGVDWPIIQLAGQGVGAGARFGDINFYATSGANQIGGFLALQDGSGVPQFQMFVDARSIGGQPASYFTVQTSTGAVLSTSFYNSQVKSYFPAGNVGIGLTSPAYLLDVLGDINTTGIYRINGLPFAVTNLVDGNTVNTKSKTISHYCGYFRTESGLTLPTTFLTTTNDSAITVKRITVDPVVVSIGAGTGTIFRFTDGTTNCNVTLGPGANNATATFTTNYSSGSTLQMKVISDDNATPPTDINMVVEYIIQ